MSQRFLLESVYNAAEYDPRYPAGLRAVGMLLDAAIDGPSPDPDFEQLLRRVQDRQLATQH